MTRDPWTDPDPQPGDFDGDLVAMDPCDVQVVEAGSGGRVRLVVPDVITDEWKYRIAKEELRRFAKAIEAHDEREPGADVDPKIHRAMRDSLQSEADELAARIDAYEERPEG